MNDSPDEPLILSRNELDMLDDEDFQASPADQDPVVLSRNELDMLDDEGGEGGPRGPIKGRVTVIRFLTENTYAPEDGESEHELSEQMFTAKIAVETTAGTMIIVQGSTEVGKREELFRKQVAILGGTWKHDDYDNDLVLSDAAIVVLKPKLPAAVIFTRAKLPTPTIEKVIKKFGQDDVIKILAGDDGFERIKEIKGIRDATAEKFVIAAKDNSEVSLELLALFTESGIAGHKALKLVKRHWFKNQTIESLAPKIYHTVSRRGGLRFNEADKVARHPLIEAINPWHPNKAPRIIAWLVDVMGHSITFGYDEYIYQGHSGYFLYETPESLPMGMPLPLHKVFMRQWKKGLPATKLEVGAEVSCSDGQGTIISIEPSAGDELIRIKLKAGGVSVYHYPPAKIADANAVAELEAAWNAARQSEQWKTVFIERRVDGKEVLYLASEVDYEKKIAQNCSRFPGARKNRSPTRTERGSSNRFAE
jgi:hypothetical protein